MVDMWKTNCPLKRRNFLWLCFRGKVQCASQLETRKWEGLEMCVRCGMLEDVDLILFNCLVASYVWCLLRDWFQVGLIPRSRDEFIEFFLKQGGANNNSIVWYWFALSLGPFGLLEIGRAHV